MKKIARRIVKVASFVLIFVVLFYMCQFVLHYRWAKDEDIYTRNLDFENQPKDSIDVLYFGTSEIYAAVDPIITYASEGITGYNFAVTNKSAVTAYYQLMYTLKHQSPQVVACDFAALFYDSLPDTDEALYRKIYETMPDKEIKKQLLDEIMKLDPNQDYLSWKLPFLRYHSIWSELRPENFKPDYRYDSSYPSYKKGSLMSSEKFKNEVYKISPELWTDNGASTELSDISVKYYDMFIEECKSKNIKVIGLIPPKVFDAGTITATWETIKGYFDSRGIDYLNYNSYEQISRINLNFRDHYYDTAHLNTLGSVVFSKTLAADLKTEFGLQGHKNDEDVSVLWNQYYDCFKKEIPDQQPDFDKFLLMASELNMNTLIYLNDENAINYEKYYTALEKQGIDCVALETSGIAILSNRQGQVITDPYTLGKILGVEGLCVDIQNEQVMLSTTDQKITIISQDESKKTDLCAVTFDENMINVKCFLKAQ